MNDVDIRKSLFDRFKTINTVTGKNLIKYDSDGNIINVAFPNVTFSKPSTGQWFELNLLVNAPNAITTGEEHINEWTGILQIDLCVPLNVGYDQIDNQYNCILQLYPEGLFVDDYIHIEKCYSPSESAEEDCYRKIVRIQWTADVDN